MDWIKLCELCWKLDVNMTKQSLAKSGMGSNEWEWYRKKREGIKSFEDNRNRIETSNYKFIKEG